MDITSSETLNTDASKAVEAKAGKAQPKKKKELKKKIATLKHPTLQAIVDEKFRFEDKESALNRLESVKRHFILSKDQPEENLPDGPYVRLWIKGYSINKKQKVHGALGNFALIGVRKVQKRWTLYAIKEDVEIKKHPQRKRPKLQHPDWGHPILRTVTKDKDDKHTIYNTIEAADAAFQKLHAQYPNTSIPSRAKLFIMIYTKPESETENPVKKWVLEIKAAEEGGFYIDAYLNTYERKEKKPKPAMPKLKNPHMESVTPEAASASAEQQPTGYFASMVQVKRASKGRAPIKKPGAEAFARKPEDNK